MENKLLNKKFIEASLLVSTARRKQLIELFKAVGSLVDKAFSSDIGEEKKFFVYKDDHGMEFLEKSYLYLSSHFSGYYGDNLSKQVEEIMKHYLSNEIILDVTNEEDLIQEKINDIKLKALTRLRDKL